MDALPRRAFLQPAAFETAPPPLSVMQPRVSSVRALVRLLVWLTLLLRFSAAVAWDQIRGRNSAQQRAGRLRRTLERAGGTFVKIGQTLAMREDLAPWAYGVELSLMLDRVPSFPLAHAIAAVERRAGRALAEIFDRFDPEPVGSTSTACTYQAILLGGERVVVKVLRPGAREQFLADLKVCDWLAAVLEFCTVLRPGSTSPIRRELRVTLMEELDFVREARQQALFRRMARRSGRRFFTAPRVHFELSGHEIIVQEFVEGVWLWELVSAVEQNNEQVLTLARQLDIDPAVVARRLVWVSFWSWQENLFFPANPHPDKVILGAGGTLTFTDFTATASMESRTMRRALHQNMYYAARRDPVNMARATLALLEPMPAVDVLELTKELEVVNWQQLYVYASRPGVRAPADRSSAVQWMGLIQTARKFHIPIESGVLQLLRAIVLFETTAMRLDPALDLIESYRRFVRWKARRAEDRLRRSLKRRVDTPLDDTAYLRLEQLANTGLGLFFRMRHALSMPRVAFNSLMSKGSFLFATLVTFATQALATAVVLAGGLALAGAWLGHDPSFRRALGAVFDAGSYRALLLLLIFLNGRALLFRFDDKDA